VTALVSARDTTLPSRVAEASVRVLTADGRPLAETFVTVHQVNHAFLFGNIAFDLVGPRSTSLPTEAASNGPAWLDLYNLGTLPFYWRQFEPEPDHPRTEQLADAARNLRAHGVRPKGHTLAWHTLAPLWLRDALPTEIAARLRDRVTREVGGFAGLIDLWDVVNEPTILPIFTAEPNALTALARKVGRLNVLRLAFEAARAANPAATLLLNDFDLTADFEHVIEQALDAGVPIDVIGLQTHMHQGFRGEDDLAATVERFARFGLPIHMTETSLVSGHLMPPEIVDLNDYRVDDWPSTPEGEARQADEMVRHYRCLLAQPSVRALTYWGLCDAGAWLHAPIGLFRADGSPKPSYAALHDLIKGDWWIPPTRVLTDADGCFRLRGWFGGYRVDTNETAAGFELSAHTPLNVALDGQSS
jgi:GH35 family endo-1,4-beta-xylanase